MARVVRWLLGKVEGWRAWRRKLRGLRNRDPFLYK